MNPKWTENFRENTEYWTCVFFWGSQNLWRELCSFPMRDM